MRIVAGQLRGRALETPKGHAVRPTSDRTREALFSILESGSLHDGRNLVRGAFVLDAFAGTGALGLEALSRGATKCTFLDRDRDSLTLLRRNITKLGLTASCQVREGDALRPPAARHACGLVFLDPPYGKGLLAPAVEALKTSGWIDGDSLIVMETDGKHPEELPGGLQVLDRRRYGKSGLVLARLERGPA